MLEDRRVPGPAATRRERAQRWLVRELERSGGVLTSAELERRAAVVGITARTLRRARLVVGVRAVRGDGRWFVVLPESPDPEVPE